MAKRKELSTERPRKGPKRKNLKVTKARCALKYERSNERYTWKGVLYSDGRRLFKIIPPLRDRKDIDVPGSCTWIAMTSALEAVFRSCGVEVGQLSWEDLLELVGTDCDDRIVSCLRALKYKGIRTRDDYLQGNTTGKRYKISQYTKFDNPAVMTGVAVGGLDKENLKSVIDNALSKSVMICHFPISLNYTEYEDGLEHIYQYDPTQAHVMRDGRVSSHTAVVTGFGFEEDTPYFQIMDSNGKKFGKKGFVRILPSSIIAMYAFDIMQD